MIAGFSGFIAAAGAPPEGLLAASWVALVPLILMATRESSSWQQAALFGLVGGLGVGLGGFPWISEMLVKFAGVPVFAGWVGMFVFSVWMAIPYAIWAAGLRLGPRLGLAGVVWPAVLFVSVQTSWPVIFPYTLILGFAETPQMIQLAELLGVAGIEALVVAASVCVSRFVAMSSGPARFGYAAVGLVTPLLVYAYGDLRMAAVDREAAGAATIRLGIVQPNVGIDRVPLRVRMDRLTIPSQLAEERGAELIIWPEAGAYPFEIERPFTADEEHPSRRVLSRHRTPTVFGAGSRVPGERFSYNSAYYVDGEGRALGAYDKVNLVPLGESIPIIDPDWLTDRIPSIGHRERGDAPARFVLERSAPSGGSVSFAPLICYEDIIAGYVHRVAAQEGGVDLFVNLTIDAWYGDSAEPWEHLALAQFRAVEHRVPIVRSVITGVSAIVDHNGRLVSHAPLRPVTRDNLAQYPPEILVETLRLPRNTARQPTVFARYGWFFPYACQVVVIAWLVGWLLRRSRGARVSSGS